MHSGNGKAASLLFFLLAAFLAGSSLFLLLQNSSFPNPRSLTASIYPSDDCINECGSFGQTACEGLFGKRLCGNFDADSCLEWGQAQSCFRDFSCGYGDCLETQRPNWFCNNGDCEYACQDSEDSCPPNSLSCSNSCPSLGTFACSYIDPIFQKRQVCGGNSYTGCRQWYDLEICQGSEECGYEECKDNQKPVWKCQDGLCDYDCQDEITCCIDECSQPGGTECQDGSARKICGQSDQDPCLDWKIETCSGSGQCGYGNCQDSEKPVWSCFNNNCNYSCQADSQCCNNECFVLNETKCESSSGRQICGNFDSDICLEWSATQSCSEGKPISCGYGICEDTEKPNWNCSENNCSYSCKTDSSCSGEATDCKDDCQTMGQGQCADNTSKKTCGYFDKDPCLDWSSSVSCTGPDACGYGKCADAEKPQWACKEGKCDFNCVASSQCSSSGGGSSSCQDECAARDQKKCADNSTFQNCSNYDSDSCLEWGPVSSCSCSGDSSCGSGGCQVNQKPVCKCQNGFCSFACQDDESCSSVLWIPEPVCQDNICDSGEDASCPEDCQGKKVEVTVLAKKAKDTEWKSSLSALPKEKINIRIAVKNVGETDFSNILMRAELADSFIYQNEVKIDEEASKTDIRQGIDSGFFPAKSEKVITFTASVSSKAKPETEAKIEGIAEVEAEKVSNSVSIKIEKPASGAKWYIWVIAVLIAMGVFIGFMALRARASV